MKKRLTVLYAIRYAPPCWQFLAFMCPVSQGMLAGRETSWGRDEDWSRHVLTARTAPSSSGVFQAGGHRVTICTTGSIDAIAHYGFDGAKSDNHFAAIRAL